MPSPLVLPRIAWGDPHASRRAILAHGLGSNGPLMWLFGTALADAGWYAEAVDLRGHGVAPRHTDYSLQAYGTDLVHTRAEGGWDVAIGHSLGGVAVTVAAALDPEWTRRLVLVDPALFLSTVQRRAIAVDQRASLAVSDPAEIRAQHAHWHENDVESKARAVRDGSHWGIIQTTTQNDPWDVRADAARVAVPAHVLGADPARGSLFTGELAAEVLAANPRFTMSVIAGAGHSLHRDKPAETITALKEVLA